jgi:hypothetical protein
VLTADTRHPNDHAGEGKGTAKVWSYPGMEKLVQHLRKKIDGVSELFTLDASRGWTTCVHRNECGGRSKHEDII